MGAEQIGNQHSLLHDVNVSNTTSVPQADLYARFEPLRPYSVWDLSDLDGRKTCECTSGGAVTFRLQVLNNSVELLLLDEGHRLGDATYAGESLSWMDADTHHGLFHCARGQGCGQ